MRSNAIAKSFRPEKFIGGQYSMNVVMFTNTFTPHIGGVARSVSAFAAELRKLGHAVLVVAPEFPQMPENEVDVLRIPAIQNFNGSDFSVALPMPALLLQRLRDFSPDIVHSHHPFLLGDTALRVAADLNVPLIFTHHTMYERYTHYVPGHFKAMQSFVIDLAAGYANLCQAVIAPSESIANILVRRGVESPVSVLPTGIALGQFAKGDPQTWRKKLKLSNESLVVGHVGRLAPEKNLIFLARAVRAFIEQSPDSHFLVVGDGPMTDELEREFRIHNLKSHLHMLGSQTGPALTDAYSCMDVFVFASQTETQGMVLAEAMAAGVPVIGLDAPGVREVIRDSHNGYLLKKKTKREFVDALKRFANLPSRSRVSMQRETQKTASEFSLELITKRLVKLYEEQIFAGSYVSETQFGGWEANLRRLEVRWEILSNRAEAFQRVIARPLKKMAPLFRSIRDRIYNVLPLAFNRWRLMRSGKYSSSLKPGLILVQIDGLSRTQFECAVRNRKLPFLRKLLAREGYTLNTLYSGLPSTTPAFQGELLYGRKCAVPAFAFIRRKDGVSCRMFDPEAATTVEKELVQEGPGLLEGGASYSNIYTGGAANSHFCPSSFGWDEFLLGPSPFILLKAIIGHCLIIVHGIFLTLIEIVVALVDCITGALSGRSLFAELRFIPARVGVCVLLRELVTAGAILDIARGLPIIHLNYLAYDEQAHRRGPDSQFAHWSLKGIDRAIHRIWNATTARSSKRRWEVWIYSDHGQERVTSFQKTFGQSLEDAVQEIVYEKKSRFNEAEDRGIQLGRAAWLGRTPSILKVSDNTSKVPELDPSQLKVIAMGPLGHIYLPQSSTLQKSELASELVRKLQIPMVFYLGPKGQAQVVTAGGKFELAEHGDELFDSKLPYINELVNDMILLCQHPDAGDLIVSGWSKDGKCLSFARENGAHAGPGSEETRAFALLPFEAVSQEKPYLRALDLRHYIQKYLAASPAAPSGQCITHNVRIMSYNVHSCVGTDRRHSVERVSHLIQRYTPDIICLQEIDVGKQRSNGSHQAERIAHLLGMNYFFFPTVSEKDEHFGDAVLSRYPMTLLKSEALPSLSSGFKLEPRGALLVQIAHPSGKIFRVLNTHFGLRSAERKLQLDAILGSNWLSDKNWTGSTIVCGDFNAGPRSAIYKRLTTQFQDAFTRNGSPINTNTWISTLPLRRLDYIFISLDLKASRYFVPQNRLAALASDHLPVVADIII